MTELAELREQLSGMIAIVSGGVARDVYTTGLPALQASIQQLSIEVAAFVNNVPAPFQRALPVRLQNPLSAALMLPAIGAGFGDPIGIPPETLFGVEWQAAIPFVPIAASPFDVTIPADIQALAAGPVPGAGRDFARSCMEGAVRWRTLRAELIALYNTWGGGLIKPPVEINNLFNGSGPPAVAIPRDGLKGLMSLCSNLGAELDTLIHMAAGGAGSFTAFNARRTHVVTNIINPLSLRFTDFLNGLRLMNLSPVVPGFPNSRLPAEWLTLSALALPAILPASQAIFDAIAGKVIAVEDDEIVPELHSPVCRLEFTDLAPWLGEDTVASDALPGGKLSPNLHLPSGKLATYRIVVASSRDAALELAAHAATRAAPSGAAAHVDYALLPAYGAGKDTVRRLLADVSTSLHASVPTKPAPSRAGPISGRLYRIVDNYLQLIETFHAHAR
jgi:hypothetical protein